MISNDLLRTSSATNRDIFSKERKATDRKRSLWGPSSLCFWLNLELFSQWKEGKNTMTVAEQISPCPYTVLRCLWSTVARWSPLLSSSRALVWDGGQVPPRTPGLINHPYFNICKAQRLPLTTTSSSLSHRETPQGWQTQHCLSFSEEEALFFSTRLTKGVWRPALACQPR